MAFIKERNFKRQLSNGQVSNRNLSPALSREPRRGTQLSRYRIPASVAAQEVGEIGRETLGVGTKGVRTSDMGGG